MYLRGVSVTAEGTSAYLCIPLTPKLLAYPACRARRQHEGGETLEQHLSTWLAQKMGLRQIVREWRRSILAAVEAFYQQDPEVACLHRILRQAFCPARICLCRP